MSHSFIEQNKRNASSTQAEPLQKKIDTESQINWVNSQQVDQGFGVFNNNTSENVVTQMSAVKEKQNQNTLEKENQTNQEETTTEYGEVIKINGRYWRNRVRDAAYSDDIEEAYRLALIALEVDISAIERDYGKEEAERVKKDDWKGEHPAVRYTSKGVPPNAIIISFGDNPGEYVFYPLPGFYPETKSCQAILDYYGNTDEIINEFSFEAFGYAVDALLIGVDFLAAGPTGESVPMIAGRKALWAYLKSIPKRMLLDASQQVIANGFQFDRIDWFDAAVSGAIKYKVAQKPLKAFFDYRFEDKELTIKTFDEARNEWRVRVVTGVVFDRLGSDKSEIEQYIIKTTEKVVRGQIHGVIDENE
jgi:hypothetical protein